MIKLPNIQIGTPFPKDKEELLFEKLMERYGDHEDPWGLDLNKARTTLKYLWPLYKNYFKVRVFGTDNVQDEPYMVTANHSGQIAIDGMLITMAFALEVAPPRILRAMVERFFTSLPWVNMISAQSGAVLGDRQNCSELLSRKESILVFQEAVAGVAKSTSEYYQLQRFTRGFFRLSLKENVKVLPVAVVGAEEVFPYVYQAKSTAKYLNLPALPISPLYFPLPSPIDIYIGKPYELPVLSPDAPDKEIDEHVVKIRIQIKEMIDEGLKSRREFWGNRQGGNK
jgi:1-acyl-sn-glycerol-3-phosphate acyltransferase